MAAGTRADCSAELAVSLVTERKKRAIEINRSWRFLLSAVLPVSIELSEEETEKDAPVYLPMAGIFVGPED